MKGRSNSHATVRTRSPCTKRESRNGHAYSARSDRSCSGKGDGSCAEVCGRSVASKPSCKRSAASKEVGREADGQSVGRAAGWSGNILGCGERKHSRLRSVGDAICKRNRHGDVGNAPKRNSDRSSSGASKGVISASGHGDTKRIVHGVQTECHTADCDNCEPSDEICCCSQNDIATDKSLNKRVRP